jgi:hypothetical protein
MRLLTKEDIVFLDKNNIAKFGGNYIPPYNFLHESPLDYLVDIVDAILFGEPMYPKYTIKQEYIFSILFQTIFLQMAISVPVLMLIYCFYNLMAINLANLLPTKS